MILPLELMANNRKKNKSKQIYEFLTELRSNVLISLN